MPKIPGWIQISVDSQSWSIGGTKMFTYVPLCYEYTIHMYMQHNFSVPAYPIVGIEDWNKC